VLFGDSWPSGAKGTVRLQGVTDNLGNTFVLSKLMSSKFPLIVVLSELAAQLKARSMALELDWAPRDQNEEADALTNNDFSAFDLSKRVSVDVDKIPWLIMPKMLGVAGDIYEAVQLAKTSRSAGDLPVSATAGKGLKLRVRDPW
jgi:hypothetical protein